MSWFKPRGAENATKTTKRSKQILNTEGWAICLTCFK